jgi:hypothetical protein
MHPTHPTHPTPLKYRGIDDMLPSLQSRQIQNLYTLFTRLSMMNSPLFLEALALMSWNDPAIERWPSLRELKMQCERGQEPIASYSNYGGAYGLHLPTFVMCWSYAGECFVTFGESLAGCAKRAKKFVTKRMVAEALR